MRYLQNVFAMRFPLFSATIRRVACLLLTLMPSLGFSLPLESRVPGGIALVRLGSAAPASPAPRVWLDEQPIWVTRRDNEWIAIVGIGCRLAGDVNSPADFWRFLLDGDSAVGACGARGSGLTRSIVTTAPRAVSPPSHVMFSE